MILDPIALATEGQLAPAAGGGFCPAPLTLASGGVIVIAVDDAVGRLADPTTGTGHRAHEPFDLGYWRTKYGKRPKPSQETTKPSQDEEVQDLETLREYLDRINALQRRWDDERQRIADERALKELELKTQSDNEILQARIARLRNEQRTLEEALELAAQNLELAFEAQRLVIERRRRRDNAQAAIAATLLIYY